MKKFVAIFLALVVFLAACTPSKVSPDVQKFMDANCQLVAGERDFTVFTLDDGGAVVKEVKNLQAEASVPLTAGEHWIGVTAGNKIEYYSPVVTLGDNETFIEQVKSQCKETLWWHLILVNEGKFTFKPK